MPKDRLEGEIPATAAVPVPERLTVWGLPLALSVMARVAARVPLVKGVKVTLRVQLAPAATLEPQLLVWAKSPVFEPKMATLVMFKAELPELVSVTALVALVELTA